MRPRLIALIAALVSTCACGRPPQAPESSPTRVDVHVPDAPWRLSRSEAAGHEPAAKPGTVLITGARLMLGNGKAQRPSHFEQAALSISASLFFVR